jgi:hypothetical protein
MLDDTPSRFLVKGRVKEGLRRRALSDFSAALMTRRGCTWYGPSDRLGWKASGFLFGGGPRCKNQLQVPAHSGHKMLVRPARDFGVEIKLRVLGQA